MPSTTLYDRTGKAVGDVELSDELFAAPVNAAVLHQVVTAQLAGRRTGTHDTKTRGEVRGGGAKPYRQKGTGMAGRMGNDRVTVQKLTIVRSDAARNLLLIKGAVPGARNAMVVVRKKDK